MVISCGTEVIARHRRSYKRDDFVFDPVRYVPLLERKTGALDQAAPLVGWDLPEEFGSLRRLLESRMGRRGKREFVAVLRLMETFSLDDVHVAVRDAIGLGALSFDAFSDRNPYPGGGPPLRSAWRCRPSSQYPGSLTRDSGNREATPPGQQAPREAGVPLRQNRRRRSEMPRRLQVLMILQAISPRLAMRSLENTFPSLHFWPVSLHTSRSQVGQPFRAYRDVCSELHESVFSNPHSFIIYRVELFDTDNFRFENCHACETEALKIQCQCTQYHSFSMPRLCPGTLARPSTPSTCFSSESISIQEKTTANASIWSIFKWRRFFANMGFAPNDPTTGEVSGDHQVRVTTRI